MKKNLSLFILLLSVCQLSAQRYLNPVFSNVTVTSNVVYGSNMSVLTGTPASQNLTMDVYQPSGDSCTNRPLVIYLHAGTALPIIYNISAVGTKTDSAVVEICTQLAKRGYVVVSMDYRLGW